MSMELTAVCTNYSTVRRGGYGDVQGSLKRNQMTEWKATEPHCYFRMEQEECTVLENMTQGQCERHPSREVYTGTDYPGDPTRMRNAHLYAAESQLLPKTKMKCHSC